MQNISLNFELPPQIPIYICMRILTRVLSGKRVEVEGCNQVQALRVQYSSEKATETTSGLRCRINNPGLISYNMDFSALTNSIQMNRIDQISVTFFDKYSFRTAAKISELGRRRFIDNLFYSFGNCSSRICLVDQSRDIAHAGNMTQLSDVLAELIERDKHSLDQNTLDVKFDGKLIADDRVVKLIDEFPFLRINLEDKDTETTHKAFVRFLDAACKAYRQTHPNEKGEEAAYSFRHFLETFSIEDRLLAQLQQGDNLNEELEKFKSKLSAFFPINMAQSVTEIGDTVERKLQNFRKSLGKLSQELTLVSKQPNFAKLKGELDILQKALGQVKKEIYQPLASAITNSNDRSKSPIHFEDKDNGQENQEAVPFFAFYRVKSVTKHKRILKNTNRRSSKNPSSRSIKTFEYGFSELGSSDSVSYHICDPEGKTLSNGEEFSDDNGSNKTPLISDTLRISVDRLIKKNQSMNQFVSKESHEEQLSRTINLDEDLDKNRAIKQSITFAVNEMKIANLTMENGFLKKNLRVLGIKADDFVDKSGGEWRVINESELEDKLKKFSDLQSETRDNEIERQKLEHRIQTLTNQLENLKETQVEAVSKYHDHQGQIETMNFTEQIKSLQTQLENVNSENAKYNQKINTLVSEHRAQLESSESKSKEMQQTLLKLKNVFSESMAHFKNELNEFGILAHQFDEIKSLINQVKLVSQIVNDQEDEMYNLRNMLAQANDYLKIYKENETEYMKEREELYYSRMTTRERILNFHDRLEQFEKTYAEVFEEKASSRMTNSIASFKSKLSQIRAKSSERSKQVKNLQDEINDVKFINGNLLKELQILSNNQQLLSREKDQLDEQLRQKEELEEKNKELLITVKMLEEKLEMSNSLREMAEQKYQTIDDNEQNFEKFPKGPQEMFGHDFNFHRHLGTIDENEELIEISDNHEQQGLRETNPISTHDDRFKSVDTQAAKNPKLEIVKSYSLKFYNVIRPEPRESYDEQTTQYLQKSQSVEFRTMKIDGEAPGLKTSFLIEKINQSETKFEKQSHDDNDPMFRPAQSKSVFDETKSAKDKNIFIGREKRSSGKKSLFSMENVLKSIGEVGKTDLKSSVPKPIGEFNTYEEQRYNSSARFGNMRGSMYTQEEIHTSRKHSPHRSEKQKSSLSPQMTGRKNTGLSEQISKRAQERMKRVIKALNRKFHILGISLDDQKDEIEAKIKSIQEKLINIELLQNIQKEMGQELEDSVQNNVLGSPKEQVQLSLTDRMKLMSEQKDYSSGVKLFTKNTSQNLYADPITYDTTPNDLSNKRQINDNKFSQLRKNYGNVAVKHKTVGNLSNKNDPGSAKNKQIPKQLFPSKKDQLDVNKSHDTNPQSEKSNKLLSLNSADEFPNVLKKELTPVSQNKSVSKVLNSISPKNLDIKEQKETIVLATNDRVRESQTSVTNNPEFEVVEKEYFRILVETKDRLERQMAEISHKHQAEIVTLQTQVNSLKTVNDSLKIESIKLLGDNEYLNDTTSEYKRILERAFETAKSLVDDTEENEVMMKPEYIDKVLEIAKVRFENFQSMAEAMDEEIRMLKAEIFPSEENHYPENIGSVSESNQNQSQSHEFQKSQHEIRKNVSKKSMSKTKLDHKRYFQITEDEYQSNNQAGRSTKKIMSKESSEEMIVADGRFTSKMMMFNRSKKKIATIYSNENEDRLDSRINSQNEISTENQNNQSHHSYQNSDQEEENEGQSENEEVIQNQDEENPHMTSFSQKQKVLKEGFYELLNSIMAAIEDNKSCLAKAQMRISSSNSEPVIKIHHSRPELNDQAPPLKSIVSLNKDLDLIKNNNIHLKEMVEFLTKNLMMFLEELEELKLETKQFNQNPQTEELIQENEFLYHKLNEAHRDIEIQKKIIEEINEKYPETAKIVNGIHRRSSSVPSMRIDDDQAHRESTVDDKSKFQDIIRQLVDFKNQGYRSVGPIDNDDEMIRLHAEQRRRLRSRIETDMHSHVDKNDQQNADHSAVENLDQEQTAHHLEELENYNIYLLNVLRQIKEIIDDNALNIKNKMVHLEEISNNLDAM